MHMNEPQFFLSDPDSFQSLYASTHMVVFRYVYGLHGGPPQEVEDITAETYLKAWRNRRGFAGDEKMALAWLFRIARNLVIDAYRRNKVQAQHKSLEEIQLVYPGLAPEDQYSFQEQFRFVWESLADLSFEQREMVILRYMLNWQVKEIAALLETSENNVSVNLRRLLARLRKTVFEKIGEVKNERA
jgi:RNA polymerase sigma-70 factor, ECF subfamily